MKKSPPSGTPPRDTITSLRAKLVDEQSLTSHLISSERKIAADRERLRCQSVAVGKILKSIGFAHPAAYREIIAACGDILGANAGPIELFDDVPF
ncbi:hypothetical protein O4H52_00915 [Sphingomonadaceae bacterium G21617-S1]|nr:hypothetical protein [Sphingomonadaceae bacterium G21617-S1]